MARTLLICAATIGLLTTSARAQGRHPDVQDALRLLVTYDAGSTGDVSRDRQAVEATRETLTHALRSSMAAQPLSASSGGFTYRLSPTLGTVERASQTFGPFYVERAPTLGTGRGSIGVTVRHASFRALDGNDLRSGTFVTIANRFTGAPDPFDEEAIALHITARTATVFATAGLTDQIDLGVAVPFIQLGVDGTRFHTSRGRTVQARVRAGAVGFGDIALRGKIRIAGSGPAAVAAGVELRLPTGSSDDLLGTGEVALGFLALASYEAGPAGVHGNLTFRRSPLGPEIDTSGALAVAATPRLTLVGEVLVRRPAGLRRITEVVAPHPRFRNVQTMRLMPAGSGPLAMFGVAGFKWNVGGTWLLHGHVLVPITDGGLTTRITPAVALDYSLAD